MKKEYVKPFIEIVYIRVEKGFAWSFKPETGDVQGLQIDEFYDNNDDLW